jgi:hypothetical protein
LAVQSNFGDFEDAVLHHSAVLAGMDCIVTRNTEYGGFPGLFPAGLYAGAISGGFGEGKGSAVIPFV